MIQRLADQREVRQKMAQFARGRGQWRDVIALADMWLVSVELVATYLCEYLFGCHLRQCGSLIAIILLDKRQPPVHTAVEIPWRNQ